MTQTPDPSAPPLPSGAALDEFDWHLVRSFLAVLDAGSLMGAARRLRAQQPTLSRHVAELEAQLGVPLFERTGRGVTPTAAALAIAEGARRMHDGAGALLHALQAARDAERGTVRLTASRVAATWLLPPLLARLRETEPGIELELVASDQVSNLLRREADIALRMVHPDQGALLARRLGEVHLSAAAHERYLARAGTPHEPGDLAHHAIVGLDRDDTILRGFASMGMPLTRNAFALRTDDQVAYGQLVAAGAGVGFVARYCLPHWPGVVPLLPQLNIPPLPCWLAVHREIHGNRLVRRVFDFLADAVPAALEAAA